LHFAVAFFALVELLACAVWPDVLLDACVVPLELDIEWVVCVVAPFTPPWWLHAPCPACDVVPSLHVTVFGVVAPPPVSVDSAAWATVANENIAATTAARVKRMNVSELFD
jgi:hypothetical protein